MLGYVRGPPNMAHLEQRNKPGNYKGTGKIEKCARLTFKDRKGSRLDPRTIPNEQYLFVRSKLRHMAERSGYGGHVYRETLLSPARDLDASGVVTWDEIIGPIQAWEAWSFCDYLGMSLQGIEYKSPDAHVRVWKEQEQDIVLRVTDLKTMSDITNYVERLACQSVIAREVDRLDDISTRLPEEGALSVLVALGRFIAPPTRMNRGWFICDIWRTSDEELSEQADIMGLSLRELKKRLARRKAGAERHGNS